jgi:hypothetical protein
MVVESVRFEASEPSKVELAVVAVSYVEPAVELDTMAARASMVQVPTVVVVGHIVEVSVE